MHKREIKYELDLAYLVGSSSSVWRIGQKDEKYWAVEEENFSPGSLALEGKFYQKFETFSEARAYALRHCD